MGNCEVIKYQKVPDSQADPIAKNEIDELYSYEPALCKLKFEVLKNGEKIKAFGTGFFCEIHDKNIPFNKALFTNNHILNKNRIKIDKQIEFECNGQQNIIKMTKDRKVFTNKDLDYTCIELLDTDNINKFFSIDKTIFDDKNSLKKKKYLFFNILMAIYVFTKQKY